MKHYPACKEVDTLLVKMNAQPVFAAKAKLLETCVKRPLSKRQKFWFSIPIIT